jgi:hypothetical protein
MAGFERPGRACTWVGPQTEHDAGEGVRFVGCCGHQAPAARAVLPGGLGCRWPGLTLAMMVWALVW